MLLARSARITARIRRILAHKIRLRIDAAEFVDHLHRVRMIYWATCKEQALIGLMTVEWQYSNIMRVEDMQFQTTGRCNVNVMKNSFQSFPKSKFEEKKNSRKNKK